MNNTKIICLRRDSLGYGFSIRDEGVPPNNTILVVRVDKDGAAERSGIRVGHRISLINGRTVKSMDFFQVFNEIRASNDYLEVGIADFSDSDSRESGDGLDGGSSSIENNCSPAEYNHRSNQPSEESPQHIGFSDTSLSAISSLLDDHQVHNHDPSSNEDRVPGDGAPPSEISSASAAHEDFLSGHRKLHAITVDADCALRVSTPNDPFPSHPESSQLSPSHFAHSPIEYESADDSQAHHFVVAGRHRTSSRKVAMEDEAAATVRFVRKRAYASARRHTGHSDRFIHDHSLLGAQESSCENSSLTIPYQLRPASSQPNSPDKSCVVEPRVTHLPRRRSTKTRSSARSKQHQPSVVARLAVFSDSESSGDIHLIRKGCSPGAAAAQGDDHAPPPDVSSNPANVSRRRFFLPDHSPEPGNVVKSDEVKPSSPTSDALCQLLHSNFATNTGDLWARAGEAYRSIDLADRLLAEKLASRRQQTEVLLKKPLKSSGGENLGPNKENNCNGNRGDSEHWTSHPQNRELYLARCHWPTSFSTEPSSPISAKCTNSTTHWTQFRNLCSGAKVTKSGEVNESSGGFLSRQCLCKILTLDGKAYKYYPWKIYHMSISGNEVKFAKSSMSRANRRTLKMGKLTKDSLSAKSLQFSDPPPGSPTLGNASDGSSVAPESDNEHRLDDVRRALSPSCITLPIAGLLWYATDVPDTFPAWASVVSGSNHSLANSKSSVSELMNPTHTGISNGLGDHADKSTSSSQQPDFRCYHFSHLHVGTELLFVFPDQGVAMTCLRILEMSGGKQIPQPKQANSTLHTTTSKVSHNELAKSVATPGLVPSTISHRSTSSPGPSNSTSRPKLKDRRQRILHPLAPSCSSISGTTRSRKTVIPLGDDVRCPDTMIPPDVSDLNLRPVSRSPLHEKTPSSARFNHGSKNPFLQSIKQLLHLSSLGSQSAPMQPSGVDVDDRLAAILGEKPDFSELDQPGPFFGCPLEKQLESPDHEFVPVMLHAFVLALEKHGLSHPGLYRKPGRQRSVNQFICVANLVPRNIDLMLTLDAWNEPYALSGLFKHFLRRLPVRLLDLVSWIPVASLVPDRQSPMDVSRTAYLLLSIRVKLWKLASQAFGLRSQFLRQNESFYMTSGDSFTHSLPRLKRNTSDFRLQVPSPHETSSASVESPRIASWQWHTLKFVVEHLRRVVACEHRNEVSYRCAAICFGPVLFDDTLHVDKLNVVVECLLEHWPWLVHGFPNSGTAAVRSPGLSSPTRDATLAEAVDYLDRCGNLEGRAPLQQCLFAANGCSTPPPEDDSVFPISDIHQSIKQLMVRAFSKADDESNLGLVSKSVHAGDNIPMNTKCPACRHPDREALRDLPVPNSSVSSGPRERQHCSHVAPESQSNDFIAVRSHVLKHRATTPARSGVVRRPAIPPTGAAHSTQLLSSNPPPSIQRL